MGRIGRKLVGIAVFGMCAGLLGGCYLFDGDRYADWPERRMERAGGGEMVARVRSRGEEQWPGDSYEVLIRWPTNIPHLPRVVGPAQREKEARAFIENLCGEEREVFILEKIFNGRVGEVYYDLWCKPPKAT